MAAAGWRVEPRINWMRFPMPHYPCEQVARMSSATCGIDGETCPGFRFTQSELGNSFIAPIRYRVDERLILARLRARGDGERLAMCLCRKVAMLPPLYARRLALSGGLWLLGLGLRCRGHDPCSVVSYL